MPESIRLVACPRPFSSTRIDLALPHLPGASIAEVMAAAGVGQDLGTSAHVFVDDKHIPRDEWMIVEPKPGDTLTVRVTPIGGGGGDDKDPLRLVLTMAITAVVFGWPAALNVGINYLIQQTVNAIVPPPKHPMLSMGSGGGYGTRTSPTLSLTGLRNQAAPYQPVPRIYGRMRVHPPLAALPYTQVEGDDQYWIGLFDVGYGPLALSDFRLGTTPLAQFEDVEMEIREGYADEDAPTLYPSQVREDGYNIKLTEAGGAQIVETRDDTDEISLDVSFSGLVSFTNSGGRSNRTVEMKFEYRAAGSEDSWIGVPGGRVTYDGTAVTKLSAPTGKTYVDYETDHNITGPVSVTLSTPEQYINGAGNTSVYAVDYRIYTRVEGESEWKQQGSMRVGAQFYGASFYSYWLFAGQKRSFKLVGVHGKKLQVRIQRTGQTKQSNSPFMSGNTVSYNAFPSPSSWSYQGEAVGNFEFTDNSPELVRRGVRWRPTSQGRYEIRCTRITDDTTSAQVRDECYLSAVRSITSGAPVTAEGHCLVALKIRASDQLSGVVDQFSCTAEALLPVYDDVGEVWEVPAKDNDPDANAKFLTRNPAWAYLDVLRGAANKQPIADDRIDIDAFVAWAAACDAAVPHNELPAGVDTDTDEPIWAFDGVFDFRTTVFEAMSDIAAATRASFGMKDGKFSIVRDIEQSVWVQHITPRNSSRFNGTRLMSKKLHGLKVRFQDAASDYKQKQIIAYADGYNEETATEFETLELFGCTTAYQAWREARYHLAVGEQRRDVMEVTMDVEHLVATAGDLVLLTHDVPRFGLASLRIKSVTLDGNNDATSVTLDEEVLMEAGKSYGVRFRRASGEVVQAAVNNAEDTVSTVTFTTPVDAADVPEAGDLASYGEFDSESVEMLVKSIRHASDLAATLTLIPAAPDVHTADQSAPPPFDTGSALDADTPAAVQNLVATQIESVQQGAHMLSVALTWDLPAGEFARSYAVYRKLDNTWRLHGTTFDRRYLLEDLEANKSIEVAVVAVGFTGSSLPPEQATGVVHDVNVPLPGDVENFGGNVIGEVMRLTWDVTPLTVSDYWRIRYSPLTTGATWSNATTLVDRIARPQTTQEVPARSGTYLIKAFDNHGQESAGAKSVITSVPDALDYNVVETASEHPAFDGTKSDVVATSSGLLLAGNDDVSEWTDISDIDNIAYGESGFKSSGTYTFEDYLDLSECYSSRITASIKSVGLNVTDTVTQWSNVGSVEDVSQNTTAQHSVRLEVRTTDDDPSGSPSWGEWEPLVVGYYKARAFEFRAQLSTDDAGSTPLVEELSVTVDMPDRDNSGKDLTSLTGGVLSVSFAYSFKAVKAIDVTVKDMASGERPIITNESATGFDIEVLDSGGGRVARNFNYIAKGYGRIAA